MHNFQQEQYYEWMFIKGIFKDLKLVDKKLTAVLLVILGANYFVKEYDFVFWGVLIFVFALFGFIQIDPCKKAKKPLVITTRIKRILTVLYIEVAVVLVVVYYFYLYEYATWWSLPVVGIVLTQLIPFLIVLANTFLKPMEMRVQKKFLNEAKAKLRDFKPETIGITGSYGKTSTKHILYHILSFVTPTLSTPGSVNTPMGITRIIRERLTREHKYFIAEMGAYGIGSVKRLCDLANPDNAIITAIGNAHYERFKTLDNVARAKFELCNHVSKKGGFTIVNTDMVDKKYIKKYGKNVILVGEGDGKNKLMYSISEAKETKDGVQFKLSHGGKSYSIKAPIYGMHSVGNIALSFAMAHKMGVDVKTIVVALKSLPQIEHRLEVSRFTGAPTLIDNAYNSNPVGFSSALGLLKLLRDKGEEGGRAILVTPGMVELGKLHDEKHYEIGKLAGKSADIAIVVIPNRIREFVKGFKETAGKNAELIEVDSFAEAKKWIDKNTTQKDVVLYENDLPDLYESKVSF